MPEKSALHALRWISRDGTDSCYFFLCGMVSVFLATEIHKPMVFQSRGRDKESAKI